MKVWYQDEIKLVTHGSAVRHVPAARHIVDCTTQPILEVGPPRGGGGGGGGGGGVL